MAVTGAIFKALTFNGESSRAYGVYITGQAVYNAPTRDVEMVTIPGRSGAFPLDHGRFENIEVTYPAGTFADNEEDFAAAISDFRNALCAAKGYCRLEDEYNPNEYRLAIYKSGLEVEPTALKAGEFDITFECKPQRYLKTGEDPVAIGASTALTNPTRFESSPEIRVKGHGTVAFNGYQIEIPDAVYGDVSLVEGARKSYGMPVTLGSDEYATNGDTITVTANLPVFFRAGRSGSTFKSGTIHTSPSKGTPSFTIIDSLNSRIEVDGVTFAFSKGTSSTASITVAYDIKINAGGTVSTHTTTVVYTASYDASADTIEMTFTASVSPTTIYFWPNSSASRATINASIYGSKSVLGDPTIIDCETGEAYKETGSGIVPLNAYIGLGAELPKLAVGNGTVTTSGSITECKIIPRWWKV